MIKGSGKKVALVIAALALFASYSWNPGGTVWFWSWNDDVVFVTTAGSPFLIEGNPFAQMVLSPSGAQISRNLPDVLPPFAPMEAFIKVERMNHESSEDAEVSIRSSGEAEDPSMDPNFSEIRVTPEGGVVFTLGAVPLQN